MATEELKQYIIKQREKHVPDDVIRKTLSDTGWDQRSIAEGFLVINPDDDVPRPDIREHFGMWVGFLYVLFFISLYVFATSVGIIGHRFIDRAVVDPLIMSQYGDSLNYDKWIVNGALSALIVSYPIFAVLLYILGKQSVMHPQIKQLRIRKQLMYITLVVTFVIMISSLIGTLYNFIQGGQMTINILGHLMVTLFIAGSIFAILLTILIEDKK